MKSYIIIISLLVSYTSAAQTNASIEQFLAKPYMQGASVSLMVKDVASGSELYKYDADREITPASVMKLVTTATVLEILGENYRYETAIMYDGRIVGNTLEGNLYIRGSGDPSLCSKSLGADRDKTLRRWVDEIKKLGIRHITGAVIADESIFDTEGISMKWLREDLGSYYGQGCYGLSIYDNQYTLHLDCGKSGTKPTVLHCDPDVPSIVFHNYLSTKNVSKDSMYIVGFPYSNERSLYGIVPANKSDYKLEGDIPDPPLFIAQRLTELLRHDSVAIDNAPTCYRILQQEGKWEKTERKMLSNSYSPNLKELVRITNKVSNNLYANAFLKTIGTRFRTDEIFSSYGKGIYVLRNHWASKGIKNSSLWMYDGSGLAPTDKVTASFLCNLLSYMATKSAYSKAFVESIPRAGVEGTVQSFLKGSVLQGKARLKSGTMNRVRCYAGYVETNNKQYAVAILVNNFSCTQNQMKKDIEQLMSALF